MFIYYQKHDFCDYRSCYFMSLIYHSGKLQCIGEQWVLRADEACNGHAEWKGDVIWVDRGLFTSQNYSHHLQLIMIFNINVDEVLYGRSHVLQALIKYIKTLKIPGAILIFLPGWNLIFALHRYLETHPEFGRAAF